MSTVNPNTETDIAFIKKWFLENYSPAAPTEKGREFMSTQQIYKQINNLYPSEQLNQETVASWLIEGGFKFMDMGFMQLEWMLKRN